MLSTNSGRIISRFSLIFPNLAFGDSILKYDCIFTFRENSKTLYGYYFHLFNMILLMKHIQYLFILSFIMLVSSCGHKLEKKRFAVWDYEYMHEVRKKIRKGNSTYRPAYDKLISAADEALKRGPYSVTFKSIVPPGGTIHDYMSMGPYWWPDSSKPDGLPFIRRDGEVNPESSIDKEQLRGLIEDVRNLTLAWYFSGEKEYAEKAAELLRAWFLDPETIMNPHLEFAQGIPGRTAGRGIGIIDTRQFVTLVDAILLLESSAALRHGEEKQIREWFAAFFEWLTTSQHGKDEDAWPNNHSVAYDAQVTAIARFLGNDLYVAEKITAMPAKRIDRMIRADGRQPEELIRTKAFSYSVSNLANFFDAGETGLKVDVNIFNYNSPDGASLKNALEFLAKYLGRSAEWSWDQIDGWEQAENNLGLLIRRAGRYYGNPEYQIIWEQAFAGKLNDHWSLLVIPGLERP